MPTIQGRAGRYTGFALALLLASFGVSSCGAEEGDPSDPGEPGAVEPGNQPSGLNPAACTAVARGGKVDICHVDDQAAVPHDALTVPTESCSTTHALHAGDFLADADTGCLHAARKCRPAGRTCKPNQPGLCCSGACLCLPGSRRCTCG